MRLESWLKTWDIMGGMYSSAVEYVPSMHEVLGTAIKVNKEIDLITSPLNPTKQKTKNKLGI